MLWLADSDLQRVSDVPSSLLRFDRVRISIPLGEIPGVRRRIVPHRPLGWRRADHAGLAAEEIGDAAEGVHAASLSHRKSSRNQADDDLEVRLHITL